MLILKKAASVLVVLAVGILTSLTINTQIAKADDSNLPYVFDGYVNKLLPPEVARGTLKWDQTTQTILDILPDGTISQFSKDGAFMKSWGTSTNGLTANPIKDVAMLTDGTMIARTPGGLTQIKPDGSQQMVYSFAWSDQRTADRLYTNSHGDLISAGAYGNNYNAFYSFRTQNGIAPNFSLATGYIGWHINGRVALSDDGKYVVTVDDNWEARFNYRNAYDSYSWDGSTIAIPSNSDLILETQNDTPMLIAYRNGTWLKWSLISGKVVSTGNVTLAEGYSNYHPLSTLTSGYVTKNETSQLYLADLESGTYTPIGNSINYSLGEIDALYTQSSAAAIGPNDEIAMVEARDILGKSKVVIYDPRKNAPITFDDSRIIGYAPKVAFDDNGGLMVSDSYYAENGKYYSPDDDFTNPRYVNSWSSEPRINYSSGSYVYYFGNSFTFFDRGGLSKSKGGIWNQGACNRESCVMLVQNTEDGSSRTVSLDTSGLQDGSGPVMESIDGNFILQVQRYGAPNGSYQTVSIFDSMGSLKGNLFQPDLWGETAVSYVNGAKFFDSKGNLYVQTLLGVARFRHLSEFVNHPQPLVAGNAVVGSSLTATPGNWDEGASLSYQWFSSGNPIPGATAASFVPTADLVNTLIRVKVTGTKPGFVSTSEMSLQAKVVTLATITQTFKPVIRGDLEVGKNLVADATGWPSDITLDYAWYSGNDYAGSGPTYTLQQWNLDRPLKVIVYASKSGYNTVGVASDPVNPVAKDFEQSNVPVITGATSIGHYLTAEIGDWPVNTSFSYKWYLDGNQIYGQYSSQYMVKESDLNHEVTVTVSASKVGFRNVTVTSEPRKIKWGIFSATNSPYISGSAKVGQTLTASNTATDPYAEISYQWLRDGNYIWGETNSTYQVRNYDYGHRISFISTWSSVGFQTSVATSPEVEIGLGDISHSGAVTITGNALIGSTIYASVGSWQSNSWLAYQWYRDGAVISGANNYYLNLSKADYGHSYSVEVTARADNYNSTVVVSDPVVVGLNSYSARTDLSGLDFSNQNLSGFDFSYANLSDANFQGADLTNARFYGANLSGASLQNANLTGVTSGNISGTPSSMRSGWRLANGYLIGSGANLSGAYLYSLSLDHLDLTGTNFANATLNYANLSFSNLNGANLSSAYLSSATLGGVRSGNILGVPNSLPAGWTIYSGYLIGPGTDLSGVNMSGQSLVGLNLRSANLAGTDFTGTDLTNADLTAANLTGATLIGTKLISTTLIAADLTRANLSGAKLNFASLQTATLSAANLTGANLSLANLTATQLDGVTGDGIVGQAQSYPDGWQVTGGKLLKSQSSKPSASIMATAQVGQILSPNTGNWDEGVVLFYQWLRDGIAISGATNRSYSISAEDAGHSLSVTVTGTKSGYSAQSVTTSGVTVTTENAGSGQNISSPVMMGAPAIGSVMSVLMTVPADTLAVYQWYRDGKKISGGNSKLYIPTGLDLGKNLSASVGLIRNGVSLSNNFTPTVVIGLGTMANPAVTVSGEFSFGQKLTAVVSNPTAAKLAYQWLRDGIEISGSSKSSYTIKAGDIGHLLAVKVSMAKPGYSTLVSQSPSKTASAADLLLQGSPRINGTLQAGKTLSVDAGVWDSGVRFVYTWQRNGIVVGTGKTYKLTQADSGANFIVIVQANKSGYNSVTVSTSPISVG